MVEQERSSIGVELFLSEQVFGEDATDHLTGARFVSHVGKLAHHEALHHGVRHAPRELFAPSHRRSQYMGRLGSVKPNYLENRQNRAFSRENYAKCGPLSRQVLDFE